MSAFAYEIHKCSRSVEPNYNVSHLVRAALQDLSEGEGRIDDDPSSINLATMLSPKLMFSFPTPDDEGSGDDRYELRLYQDESGHIVELFYQSSSCEPRDNRQLIMERFHDEDAWEQLHFVAGKEI